RQRTQTQLSYQHGTGRVQTFDYGRVRGRNAVPEGLGTIGGSNARSIEKVLSPPWDAMQRPVILAGSNLLIGLPGLRERQFIGPGDHAPQVGIESLQAREIDFCQPLGD